MTTITGTRSLIRLILRRDRFLMPLWILWISLLPVNLVTAFQELYPDEAGRIQFATISNGNAALIALYGPVYDPSLGGLVAWRFSIAALIVGLISMLTVIRHTRVEEETGRRELLGATVIGRHAGLAAALITVTAANVVLEILIAAGMLAQGMPAAGSFALGLEYAAAGVVFAAVGAVAAQLTDGAGAARGIGLGVLFTALLLRIGGDVSEQSDGALGWLSWLSPLGWSIKIKAYGGEHWWVLALFAAATAGLVAGAGVLASRRDIGSGILPSRLGPAHASAALAGPFGLAWRLHRGLILGWTTGFVALGLVLGSVAEGVGDLFSGNAQLEQILQRLGGRNTLIDAFLNAIIGIYGLLAAAYGVQAVLRLRAEETAIRVEPVLATAVGRLRWAASHLIFAVLGPTVALLAAGVTTGLVHGRNVGDIGGGLPRIIGGVLVQLPAVWVLSAIAVALVGLAPQLSGLSWGAIAVVFLLTFFGAVLRLSQWALDLSPFTHLPKVPGGTVTPAPLAWLVALALVLGAAGLIGLRRRDILVG